MKGEGRALLDREDSLSPKAPLSLREYLPTTRFRRSVPRETEAKAKTHKEKGREKEKGMVAGVYGPLLVVPSRDEEEVWDKEAKTNNKSLMFGRL